MYRITVLRVLGRSVVVLGVVAGAAGCGNSAGPAGQTDSASSASAPTVGAPTAAGDAGSSGERIDIASSEALQWGSGRYGVVLAHGAAFDAASWKAQAVRIAAQDSTVVAVEDISQEAIAAAVTYLRDERGLPAVALVGGSAGADAILQLAAEQPALPDQLVLLSPNQAQAGLGTEPKLFVASEGESSVDIARELAGAAPGTENQAMIVPGSAHAQNIFDTDQGEPVTRAVLNRLARFAGD